MALRTTIAGGLLVAASLAAPAPARAFQLVGPPRVAFLDMGGAGQGPFAVQSLAAVIYRSGATNPPGVDLPVTLQYQTMAGAPVLPPVAGVLPASGIMTVPPPALGPDAPALGHRLVVSGGATEPALGVAWFSGTWSWQTQVTLQCNDTSANCIGNPSHWVVRGDPTVTLFDPSFGTRIVTVVSGDIDLRWPHGVDVVQAVIDGPASAILLSDQSEIDFVDGQPFGSAIAPNLSDFHLTAIGVQGVMTSGPAPTVLTSTILTSFSALTVAPVPAAPVVPALGSAGAWVLAASLLAAGTLARAAGRRAAP
jgi:hypothetical protein